MMNGGGVSFPIKKGVLCVQIMERNYNRGKVLRVSDDWYLQSWGGPRLRAHTNLDRARKGYVYVKVSITVVVSEGVFVRNRESTMLAMRPEELKPGAALPCGARAQGRQSSRMPIPRESASPNL